YPTGTWAINTANGEWRQIARGVPSLMSEGADGTLYTYASNNGDGAIARYDYGSNSWTKLVVVHVNVVALSAAKDNTLFFSDSGSGTYEVTSFDYPTKISNVVASELSAVGLHRVWAATYGSLAAYKDGNWYPVSSTEPDVM